MVQSGHGSEHACTEADEGDGGRGGILREIGSEVTPEWLEDDVEDGLTPGVVVTARSRCRISSASCNCGAFSILADRLTMAVSSRMPSDEHRALFLPPSAQLCYCCCCCSCCSAAASPS